MAFNIKKWRINIYNKLIDIFNKGYYFNYNNKIKIPDELIEYSIQNTIKYNLLDLIEYEEIYKINGRLYVIELDSLDLAIEYKSKGFNPVLLNMANAINPGDGLKNGIGAQEESLFRRSCLHLLLDKKYYPLENYSALYSPDVIIISENEVNLYTYYENFKLISIITLAAHNNSNKISLDDLYFITYNKINTLFKIAIMNNHDVIILSALGCGALKNDPVFVANIFKSVIDDNNYKRYFRYIIFGIIDDYNSLLNGSNYKIFSDILT